MTSRTLPPRHYEVRHEASRRELHPEQHSVAALVCGSRHGESYCSGADFGIAERALSSFDRDIARIAHVIAGGYKGFDGHALNWAALNLRPSTMWPARWGDLGKQAGPVRNAEQLGFLCRITDAASRICLAFPGEHGTADMVAKALAASVPVYRCLVRGRHWEWVRA